MDDKLVDTALARCFDTSIAGKRVAHEFDQLIAWRGRPAMIVSDNGSELTSNAILRWARSGASTGTTSLPASRCRMRTPRASLAGSATSA